MFREKIHPHVHKIVSTLHEHGFEGYLVGGAVRDLLLDVAPKDYDISTAATPEQIKKIFGRQARIIGRRFRLVHIVFGREVYEVSTFRRKPSESERQGRPSDDGVMLWRDNEFGTLEEDAFRRDFTANALFYNPLDDSLVDLVGGRNDMENGIVRAIGNPEERMLEDPVRMIRAIKLMAQYGFKLEDELAASIRKHADKISLASKARLFEEVMKIMNKAHSCATFTYMQEYGLLKHIIPGLSCEWDMESGQAARNMLSLRDQRKSGEEFYSGSRVLALATICFGPIRQVALDFTESESQIWKFKHGVDSLIYHAVFDFFSGVSMPKFVRSRLASIINAIPRFMQTKKRNILLNHKDYYYARELFALWLKATGADETILDNWPSKGVRPQENGPHHSNKKSHPKHRRRRRPRHHTRQPHGKH